MDAVSATLDLADSQARMGMYDDAISELRRAVRAHPRNIQLHEKLGRLLAHQERFEAALPHLQKALRKKGDDGDLTMLAGNCALSTGRSKEASRFFEKCISLSWRSDEAMANLGRSLIARRKAPQAWDILHEAFIKGGSSSRNIHEVLKMCSTLVQQTVPQLENESMEEGNSIAVVGAASGSMEAMAGILVEDLVSGVALDTSGLLKEEEEDKEQRLQIAMPGRGLDSNEERAGWDVEETLEVIEKQWSNEATHESWIDDNHWESIPQPIKSEPVVFQTDETEEVLVDEAEDFLAEETGQSTEEIPDSLPFGIGGQTGQEMPLEVIDPDIEQESSDSDQKETYPSEQMNETIDDDSTQEPENLMEVRQMLHWQDSPVSGKPVIATEDRALSMLARMTNPPDVWCWTTSYGEVPWGLSLLESRLNDRKEAARAELAAWTRQNPGVWLAVDVRSDDRIPVGINEIDFVIAGLNTPVVVLVDDDLLKHPWPIWGQQE